MFFRQLLNDTTACASYVFGCKTHSKFAVVDPHIDLVDDYIAVADAQGVSSKPSPATSRAVAVRPVRVIVRAMAPGEIGRDADG